MVLGANHHLLGTLARYPRYSESIALLVQAMPREKVRFMDVGTNIGDTDATGRGNVAGRRPVCDSRRVSYP